MGRPPSLYVPLDANYVRDRAIREAGEAAELLFIRALAYCKSTGNTGHVPDYDLEVVGVGLRNVRQRIDKLVEVGLLEPVDGGWQVRSWARWNETTEEISEKKRRAAERQAAKRARDAEDESHDSHNNVTRDRPVSHTPKRREEKEQEEKSRVTRDATRASLAASFNEFWMAYPRKTAKGDAEKAWPKAVKLFPADQLTAAASRFAQQQRGVEEKYIPHPSTWLNQKRWEDEPTRPTGTTGQEYTPW